MTSYSRDLKDLSPKDRVFKARLLKLAKFAATQIPDEQFNFRRFFTMKNVLGRPISCEPSFSVCGTVGCVLGHATRIPEFKKLGLRLRKDEFGWVNVAFGDRTDNNSAADLFGLTQEEFDFLFIPREDLREDEVATCHWETYGCYGPRRSATAQDVASHIRWFVSFKYENAARKNEPPFDEAGFRLQRLRTLIGAVKKEMES